MLCMDEGDVKGLNTKPGHDQYMILISMDQGLTLYTMASYVQLVLVH